MKKFLRTMLVAIFAISLTSCGSNQDSNAPDETKESQEIKSEENKDAESSKKATLIVNGSLGDLGFFDSANSGMQRIKDELNIDIKVVETGDDETKWEPALADAADTDTDYIIAVSPSMVEPVQKLAPEYPEKRFILIDNSVDFDADDLSNVYCATFKQNEGSFLAGVAAALASEGKPIGFIGGMDIPPINDFLVGYIQGAQSVNKDIKVLSTYVGDYYDPAKGKEFGLIQFNEGSEVVFAAAGPSGLGSIEAAVERNKKIIGVDSDQAMAYKENGDEDTAEKIVTSMMKNVGDTIFNTIEKDLNGNLNWGTSESLGIKEKAVGLAKNEYYNKAFTEEQKSEIERIEKSVVDGEIKVNTAIGMPQEELDKLRNSVKPN